MRNITKEEKALALAIQQGKTGEYVDTEEFKEKLRNDKD